MIRSRFLAVTMALVVMIGTLVLAPVGYAVPGEDNSSSPIITIEGISPEILTNEDSIKLTIGITADEADDLVGARLGTFVHADPFEDIDEVDAFLAEGRNDSWSADEYELSDSDISQATSGGARISIDIPFADLPLWNTAAWGPYGVTVRLLPRSFSWGGDVPQSRTLLLWYPPGSEGDTRVNVTVPNLGNDEEVEDWSEFIGKGVTIGLSPAELRLFMATSPQRGLEVVSLPSAHASLSLLAATEQGDLFDLAAFSRLVDPTARDEGDGTRSATGSTSDSGTTPQSQGGEVAQSGGESSLDDEDGSREHEAHRQFLATLDKYSVDVIDDVIVADEDWWGLRTLQLAGNETVLSPPSGTKTLFSSSATPSSPVLIDPLTGATVIDGGAQLGVSPGAVAVLDSWGEGVEALSDSTRVGLGDLAARQRVRALTATATSASEGDLDLWVNLSASELGEDPATRLNELLGAPWITPVTLREMLAAPLSTFAREPVTSLDSSLRDEVRSQLTPLSSEYQAARDVLASSPSNTASVAQELNTVLAATAADLDQELRQKLVNEALETLHGVTRAVEVVPSGPVNVVGRNAPFPVTVKNNGSFTLEIRVGLEVSDPRLSVKEWATTVLPRDGSVTVHIPVEAVGTGEVTINAVAMTEGGTTLDVSDPIVVRVRADWEGPGIWIVAGLLGLAFIAGVVRTIKKGQRRMSRMSSSGGPANQGA
ncbi:DUF6049 family protein [Actinomyces minihominis]|uniref:DUF6049 family protein n=1 Tax=Actinomyces minihominis TaxID=2002838 RepID=UPI000C0737A6|nr:DUF6049 family protein [Actinomyces minihominis]